jgi:hypothetical protein
MKAARTSASVAAGDAKEFVSVTQEFVLQERSVVVESWSGSQVLFDVDSRLIGITSNDHGHLCQPSLCERRGGLFGEHPAIDGTSGVEVRKITIQHGHEVLRGRRAQFR